MKHIILALFLAIIAMPAIASEQGHALKPVEAKYICMVNNTVFDKEQIAVEVDGKTYYGCCSMCEERLKKDTAIRSATDPVSGKEVDKALAVIGADNSGKVYYFESMANLETYKSTSESQHSEMMHEHEGMAHENMTQGDTMEADKKTADLTQGSGILNKILKDAQKINITHGPIPALQWPEMTMDIPVSKAVDLSSFTEGDNVRFFLKLEDKTYVIEKMEIMDDEHAHEGGHGHHE